MTFSSFYPAHQSYFSLPSVPSKPHISSADNSATIPKHSNSPVSVTQTDDGTGEHGRSFKSLHEGQDPPSDWRSVSSKSPTNSESAFVSVSSRAESPMPIEMSQWSRSREELKLMYERIREGSGDDSIVDLSDHTSDITPMGKLTIQKDIFTSADSLIKQVVIDSNPGSFVAKYTNDCVPRATGRSASGPSDIEKEFAFLSVLNETGITPRV